MLLGNASVQPTRTDCLGRTALFLASRMGHHKWLRCLLTIKPVIAVRVLQAPRPLPIDRIAGYELHLRMILGEGMGVFNLSAVLIIMTGLRRTPCSWNI
ncbi:uncharacterized protein B0I36DRAFT_336379 [Microdochium trichocladiopsis]|uniref:Ankyrin repeat-containing domain protein n=1 Tax=Microdochium trichocladiopsis TaxID=1682393 RepID=A0A9P8XSP5_9PEZI|nr:uncharacterized protein B0I36DRAFT_336379 [Microdochium trichocladiopsis]KAH7016020.1 hypothetical protein B0I36DRAFT_336379 [Microdochium trichocladiopsis]